MLFRLSPRREGLVAGPASKVDGVVVVDAVISSIVHAINAAIDGRAVDPTLDSRIVEALGHLTRRRQRTQAATTQSFIRFLRETTETAINIGWITHDIREVADNTQSIGSATTQLTASIGEIASTSRTSADQATELGTLAHASRGEMRQTSTCMREISDQVGSIGPRVERLAAAVSQITGMVQQIDAISNQTSLLALNATIEAARAGEAGKGFAVVASEVKALAANSANATRDIRQRIELVNEGMAAIRSVSETSIGAVAEGEAAAGRSEQKIELLASGVSDIIERIDMLARLFAQQQDAAGEISKGVTRISDKAVKVQTEINTSLDTFKRAESTAIQFVRDHAAAAGAVAPLLLGQAKTIAWRRAMAATLVCLQKPAAESERCSDSDIERWSNEACSAADGGALEAGQLQEANARAHEAALRMCNAIRANQWDLAISSYQEAEAATKKLLAMADRACTAASIHDQSLVR